MKEVGAGRERSHTSHEIGSGQELSGARTEITKSAEAGKAVEIGKEQESFRFGKKEIDSREVSKKENEIERAQIMVEKIHERAKGQIVNRYEAYMPPESLERVQKGVKSIEAKEHDFSKTDIGGFQFHLGESKIQVDVIDVDQMERTTIHETNHFAAYNKEIIKPLYQNETGVDVEKQSGIHKLLYKEGLHGQIIECKDVNRGFNEGITEFLTIENLKELDEKKAETAFRQSGYQQATEIVIQLDEILGKDTLAKAYYGGDVEGLRQKINQLGGENAFERLSKHMDQVTYSPDYVDRWLAMQDAQEILANMYEAKEIEGR